MNEIRYDIKDYASLNVYTDSENIMKAINSFENSIKRTIPVTDISCTKIKNDNIKFENSIFITESKNKKMFYDKETNLCFLNVDSNELRGADLIYISLVMFSKILGSKKKFLLHSSSVVDSNNNGFVFVGSSNAGKTSMAYEMTRDYNCKLISNDHTVVGMKGETPTIFGGTKPVQMRLGAVELYFPELYEKVKVDCDNKWEKKIIVNDAIENGSILSSTNDVVPIKDIYSISAMNQDNCYIETKETIDQFLFLYDNLSRPIKGTYNYIVGFDYPMPSIEDDRILTNLSDFCKKVSESNDCNVHNAKGSLFELSKKMVKKYEK